jgi:hypothetical protein
VSCRSFQNSIVENQFHLSDTIRPNYGFTCDPIFGVFHSGCCYESDLGSFTQKCANVSISQCRNQWIEHTRSNVKTSYPVSCKARFSLFILPVFSARTRIFDPVFVKSSTNLENIWNSESSGKKYAPFEF